MWSGKSEHAPKALDSPTTGNPSPSSPHERPSDQPSEDQKLWGSDKQRTSWRPSLQGIDTYGTSSPIASPSSESPFGAMSPAAADRVFPIRSVVSLDPTPTPKPSTDTTRGDEFPGISLPRSTTSERTRESHHFSTDIASRPESVSERAGADSHSKLRRESGVRLSSVQDPGDQSSAGARQVQAVTDSVSTRSQTTGAPGTEDTQSTTESVRSLADDAGGLFTARFKHVVTKEGHAVIVGRDGDTLQRCEDEPIHIPGAVQGFGLLIALQEIEEGKFQVRIVSENSKKIIGYTPKQLFDLESFTDILSEEQTDNLLDHIDFIRAEDVDPATNGPEVFTLAIRSPARKIYKMWCAMHSNENNRDLIICEFELEDDPINPLVPPGEGTPEPPEDTLNSEPTPEEFAESTVNASKPLRVLRSARKRKGEAAAMEVFNIMSQVQEQLASATTLDAFLKTLVGVVKELTGFHRVMVYQFDQKWNGRVVTELVDPRATKDLYKGLNFPASDIPKQARDLYKINKVRLLYDRDQETARLVCRTTEDLENPLDLTFAYLRAMSPIHIKYLTNMAVRASMSISINAFSELWGLIACHSYGSKGMRVSFPIRKMCRLVGDSASRNIERLSYASRLQARKLINTAPTESNPSGYIIASSDDLLKLFDADSGLLSIRDETKILGRLEQTQEALAMLEYLRLRKITSVTNSMDIRLDFPDLRYSPGISVIAGLLLVPLSISGNDFIVFFRKGQSREVKWAGNPYEKFVKEGTEGYLEPRKSFRTWSETVVGKCREWTEEQIETAAVLCLVYGKFIEVWRQKEAALQNSELTKLLLANSAHEVRTPLNAIINYLEIALEGAIDQETRDNLSRSHSASKSLIYVINDLLDLTKTEEGHSLIKDEVFDLPATVKEATDSFTGDAKRKQIEYAVSEHPGVPQFVVGDQRRVRQAISNVTANAIQHTLNGAVNVELWLANSHEHRVEIDIVVQDTGAGMSAEKLDALFNDLEQVQTESDEGLQEKLAGDTKAIEGKGKARKTLGLGLALVARIVRNMNGQLRLKSEEGKGSRFVMQLGFDLPKEDKNIALLEGMKDAGVGPPSNQPSTPPVETGEVMLVNKSAQKPAPETPKEIVHRRSAESLRSVASMKSFKSGESVRSDVDRLIEAIQEPRTVATGSSAEGENEGRPGSRGSGWRQGPSSSSRRPISGITQALSTNLNLSKSSDQVLQPRERPGLATVTDSKTPIRPIRMPGETSTGSPEPEYLPRESGLSARTPSRVLFSIPDKNAVVEPPNAERLQVLVAEDDPINSKIIKKRLEKVGHEVCLTINGEECSSTYGERPAFFDVVLMDMQMPIVDGLTSTKMIRSFEKSFPDEFLSRRAALNGRVPIFAVSASLIEKNRQVYIDAGFDGWILKPIDFKRLTVIITGIVEEKTRKSCLYEPGKWERGGWFAKQQPDVFTSYTKPSSTAPVSSSKSRESYPAPGKEDSTDRERERLNQLDNDAVHADSLPQNSGRSGDSQYATESSSKSES
ncbi:MAG: Light-sensor Protein kinase [Alectoria sarmentosa]|nr:MAG: Light-sensor Protein kinase [Alectoria sarmentosa]